jgi:methylphosphotriester-DNA--protein-cysteine methyltransferase
MKKTYLLLDGRNSQVVSDRPGTLGGHRKLRIYGRLNCASALRYLAKGQYAQHRVFFIDESTARAAGYRPCARCMPSQHAVWKAGAK